MTALERRLEVALAVTREAGAMALRLRPPPGAPVATLKGVQDWLTEADAAVERFVSERILAAFPEDGFQGEELGAARGGVLRWVVDPIDGTANFARGASRFCVSLGLIEERAPLLGVIVAPALGEVFAARQGAGATLNGVAIRAAETTEMSRATIECGWSPRRDNIDFLDLVGSVMDLGATMRAGGSGAMGLADVAAGRIDAYVELHINLWDVAAGLAILAEAGAFVSDFLGGEGPTKGAPILASAPGIAEALRRVWRDDGNTVSLPDLIP